MDEERSTFGERYILFFSIDLIVDWFVSVIFCALTTPHSSIIPSTAFLFYTQSKK
jgi:hypothetical protein